MLFYSHALSKMNKSGELQIPVQLQDLVWITETWWVGSHGCSTGGIRALLDTLARKRRSGRYPLLDTALSPDGGGRGDS